MRGVLTAPLPNQPEMRVVLLSKRKPDAATGHVQPGEPEVEGRQDPGLDGASVSPPIDIIVRVWMDRLPEVIATVDDWLVRAALNEVLNNYVEFELTPAEEEE